MLIFVVLGLILCDQPTGAPLFTHSDRFTAEDWSLIFNQVAAIQTAGSTVAAIYTVFYDYRETADAMTAAGFSGLVPYGARRTTMLFGSRSAIRRWRRW